MANSGTLAVVNSTLSNNTASIGVGGGVNNTGSVTLQNSTLSGNTAAQGGGGLCSSGYGTVAVLNSTLSGNSALYSNGGGMSVSSNHLTVQESTITGNSALSGFGGALYTKYAPTTLEDSTISGNRAADGGGLFLAGDTVAVMNCTISSNTAWNSAAGLYNAPGTILTVQNSTVSGNTAVGRDGGGIISGGTLTLRSSTVSGNTASDSFAAGGGLVNTGRVTIQNSIIAGNRAGSAGNEIAPLSGAFFADANNFFGDSGETIAEAFDGFLPVGRDFSGTSDGTTPTALIAIVEPLQSNGGPTPTVALPFGSPAINNGSTTYAVGLATDQRGQPRVVNGLLDIGAYESVNHAPVLGGLGNFTSIPVGEFTNAGDLVSTLVAGHVTDDPNALRGVAVVGLNSVGGQWQFSTNAGATWTTFGAVSNASATLLGVSPGDRIRFVPAGLNTASASITVRAWDQTDGNADGATGVNATATGGPTAFSAAAATATVSVSLAVVKTSDLLVGGTAGNDVIVVNLNSNPAKVNVTVNGTPAGTFDLAAITGKIVLNGFGGNDTLTVAGAVARDAWFVGGSGNDTLTGGGGNNTYVVTDGWGVDKVVGSVGVGTDRLDASSVTSDLTVTKGAGLSIKSGTNTLTATNLEGVAAGSGTDTLVNTGVGTWTLSGTNAGALNGTLAFSGVENLTGSSSVDTVTLAEGAGVTGTIAGGGGTNTLSFAGYSSPVTVLLATGAATNVGKFTGFATVTGGAGSDTVSGPSATTTWTIGAAGVKVGTATFGGFESLQGGAGNDTFTFSGGQGVAGSIDGGAGTNTLNFAAYTTGVTVNLALGTATDVGGWVSNVANVTGGAGNDMLVGNALANVLIGNAGRNVLIGGAGKDTLTGGAGDDILVGGATDHDLIAADLAAVLTEWSRTDATYAARVNDLLGPTAGLNGAVFLNPTTVHDDGIADTLTGGSGTDWFVTSASDVVKDKGSTETRTTT